MERVKDLGKTDAKTVAEFILKNYGPMSHLKLQKLLYYCEGYHLGYFETSLFDEQFEAWLHGPVCREVYNELKGASILYADIKFDGKSDPDAALDKVLVSKQKEILADVLNELSTWKDTELEAATHAEQPWLQAREGYSTSAKCEEIISKELMLECYKAELNGNKQA